MKRVLVTGANGFIGKPVVKSLKELGYDVYSIGRSKSSMDNYFECDLFDKKQIDFIVGKIKPNYLVHLAWDTTHNTYLNSTVNLDLISASLNLLQTFYTNGGQRALFTGTCFEYECKPSVLAESDPIVPQTLYAACKSALNIVAKQYAKDCGKDFVWARLFYLFGENEKETRVFPYVVESLNKDKAIVCKNSSAVRDYMYVGDAARAIAKTLNSKFCGDINICSGIPLSMEYFFGTICRTLNKSPQLITYLNEQTNIPYIVGNNDILKNKVFFIDENTFEMSVKQIISNIK